MPRDLLDVPLLIELKQKKLMKYKSYDMYKSDGVTLVLIGEYKYDVVFAPTGKTVL